MFRIASYLFGKPAENAASAIANTFGRKGVQGTCGIIHVKTEDWTSKDGITRRTEKTQAWGNHRRRAPRSLTTQRPAQL